MAAVLRFDYRRGNNERETNEKVIALIQVRNTGHLDHGGEITGVMRSGLLLDIY